MVGDDWFRSKVVTALLARGDGNAGGCFTASERWGGGFHSFKDTHWYMYDVSFNIGKFRLIHYFLFHFKCQKAYIIVNLLKENIFFIFFFISFSVCRQKKLLKGKNKYKCYIIKPQMTSRFYLLFWFEGKEIQIKNVKNMFMNIIFDETLEIVSLKVGLHELGLLIHKIKQAIITWERFHCCTVIGQVTKNLSPL